jgi:hypothetical protein
LQSFAITKLLPASANIFFRRWFILLDATSLGFCRREPLHGLESCSQLLLLNQQIVHCFKVFFSSVLSHQVLLVGCSQAIMELLHVNV